MLLPMGLPPDVRVIAWGLSLERPTMIKYRCKNIRDLFGHKVCGTLDQCAVCITHESYRWATSSVVPPTLWSQHIHSQKQILISDSKNTYIVFTYYNVEIKAILPNKIRSFPSSPYCPRRCALSWPARSLSAASTRPWAWMARDRRSRRPREQI